MNNTTDAVLPATWIKRVDILDCKARGGGLAPSLLRRLTAQRFVKRSLWSYINLLWFVMLALKIGDKEVFLIAQMGCNINYLFVCTDFNCALAQEGH